MGRETPVIIQGFTGVNTTDPANIIQDSELTVCDNFDIGRNGELTRRPGWNKINTTAFAASELKLLGHYKTATHSQLIAHQGTTFYTSTDAITWTAVAGVYSDVQFGLQYTDKFYVLRSTGTILEWNGTAFTDLAGTPAATFGYVHKDRLFLFNTASTTLASRLRFSDIADFTSWPSTNFIDVNPGDGDWCVGMAVLSDILIVFKSQTIWGLYATGDPANWTLRLISNEYGTVSHYSIVPVENFLYFVSAKGVYKTEGVSFEEISYPIKNELKDRVVTQSTLNMDMAVRYGDRIIYMLHPTAAVHTHYTYYFQVKGWSRWPHAGSVKPGFYIDVQADAPLTPGLYAGDHGTNGIIYRLDLDQFTDAGVQYACTLETKDFDFDVPHEMKRGKWLAVMIENGGTVTVSYDIDKVATAGGTITDTTTYRVYKVVGPGYFRACKVKLSNTSNTKLKIFNFTLIMHAKSRVIESGV